MATLRLLHEIIQRPHITNVAELVAKIDSDKPPQSHETFNLRLCVHRASVFSKGLHIDFVDEEMAGHLQELDGALAKVSPAQAGRCKFRLTVWNPYNGPALTLQSFRLTPGTVLDVTPVSELSRWKNIYHGTLAGTGLTPVAPTSTPSQAAQQANHGDADTNDDSDHADQEEGLNGAHATIGNTFVDELA